MRLKIASILLTLLCSSIWFTALPVGAQSTAKVMVTRHCIICHHEYGEAEALAPARFAAVQWRSFFERNKHDYYYKLPVIEPSEEEQIRQYLEAHAADSDNPSSEPLYVIDFPAKAKTVKSLSRSLDPLAIPGSAVVKLLGEKISRIRATAFKDGKLVFIPYQVDEKNEKGQFVFTDGAESKPEEANGILDGMDEIAFMARDSGDQVQVASWPEEIKQVQELAVVDQKSGRQGWIYLLAYHNDPLFDLINKGFTILAGPESPEPLAVKNPYWEFRGMNNKIGDNIYKSVMIEEIKINKQAYGNGLDLIDRLKTRIFVSFLFGQFTFNFSEGSLIGGTDAMKFGDIRGFFRNWSRIRFNIGIRGPVMWQDIYMYDRFSRVITPAKVPFNPGYVITDLKISTGFDLNQNAAGMKFYNSNNLEGVTVDGKMSQAEKELNPEQDEWRCIAGPQGALVVSAKMDKALAALSDKVRTIYVDDFSKSLPPEKESGSMGYSAIEITLSHIDPGTYQLFISLFFPPRYKSDDPYALPLKSIKEFIQIQSNPLAVKINDTMRENEAAKNQGLR